LDAPVAARVSGAFAAESNRGHLVPSMCPQYLLRASVGVRCYAVVRPLLFGGPLQLAVGLVDAGGRRVSTFSNLTGFANDSSKSRIVTLVAGRDYTLVVIAYQAGTVGDFEASVVDYETGAPLALAEPLRLIAVETPHDRAAVAAAAAVRRYRVGR